MIKEIIKRDGTTEAFGAEKVNGWGIWASEHLGKHVNWADVVLNAVSTLPTKCSSVMLQDALIDVCLNKRTWSYNRMAGRLYVAKLIKDIYSTDTHPSLRDLHQEMVSDGIIDKSFMGAFSESEYAELNAVLEHSKDLTYAHYAIDRIIKKYSLQNRSTGKLYETPQFVYMRIAMRMAMNKSNRMKHIKKFYELYSDNVINVPTPYFTNSGTSKNAFASCCLYTTKDEVKSLHTGDVIAYAMTYSSAGIGGYIQSRSVNDEVRGGIIQHQGKLPYYRSAVAAVKANLQNGRGGAITLTYSCYDPEIAAIQKLKNPLTPQEEQIRGADYSMTFNKFFAQKAAKNEEVALFSMKDAPEIYDNMHVPTEEFAVIYNKAVKEKRYHSMVNARDILARALMASIDTGRHYWHYATAVNEHTPFKEPIKHSNLCLVADTLVTIRNKVTKEEIKITLEELNNIFDHNDFKHEILTIDISGNHHWKTITDSALMGFAKILYDVTLGDNGVRCTAHHDIVTLNRGKISAKELTETDILIDVNGNQANPKITKVVLEEAVPVYDITVDDFHTFIANDILVGNCQEIQQPTFPYNDIPELYYGEEQLDELYAQGEQLGETAMCSLAGIVVSNVKSEEHYREAAYYALLMIHTAIHESDYPFSQIAYTTKARNSAGVAMIGLAHYLAKLKTDYTSEHGRNEIHKIAERHYWHLVNASLEMSKEYGNAKWIHKTKWPEGWTPIDTYCKEVDGLVTVDYQYDWHGLSENIKANGGIHNSILCTQLPSESSSVSAGTTNGVYPIRRIALTKTNDSEVTYYIAPDSERLAKHYQIAYDIPTTELNKAYAIIQKFTDQGMSCDDFKRITGDTKIPVTELLKDFFTAIKYNQKSRYYINEEISEEVNLGDDEECESCTL